MVLFTNKFCSYDISDHFSLYPSDFFLIYVAWHFAVEGHWRNLTERYPSLETPQVALNISSVWVFIFTKPSAIYLLHTLV